MKPIGTDQGYVMNYETMEGAFNGLTRLYSPILGRTSASCELEFYYYKVEQSNGRSTSLALYIENADTASKERVWRVDANSPNNDWARGLVSLHSRRAGMRLYFEASHSEQVTADRPLIALDNVDFLNCQTVFNTSCSTPGVFNCSASNCIPGNLVAHQFDQ